MVVNAPAYFVASTCAEYNIVAILLRKKLLEAIWTDLFRITEAHNILVHALGAKAPVGLLSWLRTI